MVGSAPVYAQEAEHESGSGHETEHNDHKNVLSFFTGLTHGGRRNNALALGVGYERLLNESFGIGVLAAAGRGLRRRRGSLDPWCCIWKRVLTL